MLLKSVRLVGGAPDVDARDEVRDTMQKLSEKFGEMVSSYDMAHAPLVLGAYGRFQQAITDHGTFDVRTREAIALAVAAVDDCADCQFPHIVGCRAVGWTPDQISALRSGAQIRYEEKLTALLAVARQVADNTGDVDERTWREALQTGWTIDELAELFTHVFANIFTNYLNHYTRADMDYPAAPAVPAGPGFREASA